MSKVHQLMSLGGRRALITGAAGELGKAMASALASLGADLLLIDRHGSDFTELSEILKDEKVQIHIQCCDLEVESEREKLIRNIIKSDKGLSILVNNAAFAGTAQLMGWAVPFEQQSLETWRRAFEVNLTAIFHLCQGLAPILNKSSGASIVNISSIYGFLGPIWKLYEGTAMGNPAAYAASKGGLIQLTRWLSTTMAPRIRVNSISPGGVWRNQPDKFHRRYVAHTPLERMATEDDIIGAIIYLASDLSRYVTGHNLVVDGGWSAW